MVHRDAIPDRFSLKEKYLPADIEWFNPGHSVIVDPDGKIIAGPAEKEETIVRIPFFAAIKNAPKDLEVRVSRSMLEEFYEPWIKLAQSGAGVHCGECGCYNKTPHDIFLAWFCII